MGTISRMAFSPVKNQDSLPGTLAFSRLLFQTCVRLASAVLTLLV